MHFLGIDLAWGETKPTGVAVLDGEGRLVHVSAQSTDETITAALAPYAGGPCLVAIDAPLVVTNASGSRPCEAELNRDFRRFEAGAHPSNTGKREFAGTPRGARIAKALGLDINPASRRPRRAIEVYPHPATVVLFGLDRTLKYKHKPGRTLAGLREALRTLMGHLESLAHAETPMHLGHHEGWRALVVAVDGAQRKSELRRVEDQVDAVLCAYVARYAEAHPDRVTTYGDLQTGYIVTPTLPGPGDRVQGAVREYAARRPALEQVTAGYARLVEGLLDDAGINYLSVSGRTKSVASFAQKAARLSGDGAADGDPLEQVTDQVGLRVVTYVISDVAAVAGLLADQLVVLDDRDLGRETAQEGRFGYASRHLLLTLDPDRSEQPDAAGLRGHRVSVQLRSVLQHAWAEFEHDIRYKGSIPEEHAPDLDRRFTLAAGLIELADREFDTIRERLQQSMTEQPAAEDGDPRIGPQDLAAFLAGRFPGAGWSRTEHYAWIAGVVLELGITSLEELGRVLAPVDSAAISERMAYRYPPGAVRRLDDALLSVYGERYVALHANEHRREALATRLARLSEAG